MRVWPVTGTSRPEHDGSSRNLCCWAVSAFLFLRSQLLLGVSPPMAAGLFRVQSGLSLWPWGPSGCNGISPCCCPCVRHHPLPLLFIPAHTLTHTSSLHSPQFFCLHVPGPCPLRLVCQHLCCRTSHFTFSSLTILICFGDESSCLVGRWWQPN